MPDIDKMTSNEWLNYRDELILKHFANGGTLEPNPDCPHCDVVNDYLCFDCECIELEKGVNHA